MIHDQATWRLTTRNTALHGILRKMRCNGAYLTCTFGCDCQSEHCSHHPKMRRFAFSDLRHGRRIRCCPFKAQCDAKNPIVSSWVHREISQVMHQLSSGTPYLLYSGTGMHLRTRTFSICITHLALPCRYQKNSRCSPQSFCNKSWKFSSLSMGGKCLTTTLLGGSDFSLLVVAILGASVVMLDNSLIQLIYIIGMLVSEK